eukprot:scaffold1517_cov198-Isochrysis_galbana.AAC.1
MKKKSRGWTHLGQWRAPIGALLYMRVFILWPWSSLLPLRPREPLPGPFALLPAACTAGPARYLRLLCLFGCFLGGLLVTLRPLSWQVVCGLHEGPDGRHHVEYVREQASLREDRLHRRSVRGMPTGLPIHLPEADRFLQVRLSQQLVHSPLRDGLRAADGLIRRCKNQVLMNDLHSARGRER